MKTLIKRPPWTNDEHVKKYRMMHDLAQLNGGRVEAQIIKNANIVNPVRSADAIGIEVNRDKKASIGEWNKGDHVDDRSTEEKVYRRRKGMRDANISFPGPTRLPINQITITEGAPSSHSSPTPNSGRSNGGVSYFNVVDPLPVTTSEKLLWLYRNEDKTYCIADRSRVVPLLGMVDKGWTRFFSPKQRQWIEDIYHQVTRYHKIPS